MKLSIIAAVAENRVIGAGNRLPWSLPEDLKRFRAITSGHSVIMGRKTFESIGRPLPNRLNIVISRDPDLEIPGARVVASLDGAIEECRRQVPEPDEIFVIGGGAIYSEAMDRAERLYLTLIHRRIEGDVMFPEWDRTKFTESFREERELPIPHSYLTYDRIEPLIGTRTQGRPLRA